MTHMLVERQAGAFLQSDSFLTFRPTLTPAQPSVSMADSLRQLRLTSVCDNTQAEETSHTHSGCIQYPPAACTQHNKAHVHRLSCHIIATPLVQW